MTDLSCFKAYDIRGQLGTQIDAALCHRIGRAFAEFLAPSTVVVGGDVRQTSAELKAAFAKGVRESGADVIDIGLCGTEEVYHATAALGADGGCMVTASHNPIDYNGMKLVREGSRPISADTGLLDIRALVEADDFPAPIELGALRRLDHSADYIEHLLGYIDLEAMQPVKVVVNAGNGTAGPTIDRLEAAFRRAGAPIELIKLHNEPDPTFPNGIPNPLLHEQQPVTGDAVRTAGADLGVAWDGDFDRCFFWDADGTFIEGYYVVGLLAEAFLKVRSNQKIIYDPRLTWNTIEIVEAAGGTPVQSKSGHAFIKQRMREIDAVYGGEMSAHHYFRDFAYCDSGMIPWLLVMDLLSRKRSTLKAEVSARMARYPSPGEINSTVDDADAAIARVLARYEAEATNIDTTDGISVEFADWRFNLRKSNTEPVVRLNVETRADPELMRTRTDELLALIRA